MAEMHVAIDGPVAISGTFPTGAAIPVAISAPLAVNAPSSGQVLAASTTGDQTLFSMTSGQVWFGFFTISGSLVGTSLSANVSISCLGGSATPSAGTLIVSLDLSTGTGGGNSTASSTTPYMYIYAGTSDNDVHADVTGAAANITATAYGYLLA